LASLETTVPKNPTSQWRQPHTNHVRLRGHSHQLKDIAFKLEAASRVF